MTHRVMVTGIGIVSPLGLDRDSTWENLIKGVSGVDRITAFDAEGFATTIAAEVKGFEPAAYVGRKQARRMDRFVQLAAAATLEAVEDAEVEIDRDNGHRVSVMIASGIGGIITLSREQEVLLNRGPSRVNPFLVPMMLPDMASGQVSMLLGAKGAQLQHRVRLLQRSRYPGTGLRSRSERRRGHGDGRRRRGGHLPHRYSGLQLVPGALQAQ